MVLTDTHTHLYYEKDTAAQADLMQRCFNNQISRLFLPNVSSQSIDLVFNLAAAFPDNCFPMLGLHPCDVKASNEDGLNAYTKELDIIKGYINQRKIYAIGEIGLDLYWDKTTLEIQKEAFRIQIGWAKKLNLPIVIHCREAFEEIYEILLEEHDEKLRGIFHCFSGDLAQATKITDLGFYLGIGGVVTYKNACLDKVVAEVSLDKLVLETDSPYLTPVPYRGKPNESSYLIYIAQKVADLHHTSIEEVARITTENSKNVFNI